MNTKTILAELKSLHETFERTKNPRRPALLKDIDLFERWVEQGQNGNCPVDLPKWGISPEAHAAVEAEPPLAALPQDQPVEPANIIAVESAAEMPAIPVYKPAAELSLDGEQTSAVQSESQPVQPAVDESVQEAETILAQEPALGDLAEEIPEPEAELETLAAPDLGSYAEQAETRTVPVDTAVLAWLEEARLAARESADPERLKEAVRLCNEVLGSPETSLHSEAAQIRSQAQQALQSLLEAAMKAGEEAEKRSDEAAARAAYEQARLIDNEYENAANALLRLAQKAAGDLSRQKIIDLRLGLLNRANLARLETALRECEARIAMGEFLPDELKQLVPDARQFFDATRERDGLVITQARIGLLAQSKEAVDYYNDLLVKAQREQIFDPLSGNRTVSEGLAEANAVWLARSNEFLQNTVTKINEFFPQKPQIAKGILEAARYEIHPATGEKLLRPFQDSAAEEFQKLAQKIDFEIDRQNRAEALAAQAALEMDPIQAFKLYQQAKDAFEYLEGIDLLIQNAHQTALQYLLVKIDEEYAASRSALKMLRFPEARAAVTRAEQTAALWVSQPVPVELTKKLETSQVLRDEIDGLEKAKIDFDQTAGAIRQSKTNKDRLPEAFKLLDSLVDEERFKPFTTEIRQLNSEMDPYRGVDDKIEKAQLARSKGDWQRVLEISENLSGAGLATNLQSQVKRLNLEANMELKIVEARSLLEKSDVPKANEIISRLIHPTHELHQEAAQRLADEIKLIQEVIAHSRPFRELFESAEAEMLKPGFDHQFTALHIFRYLSGAKEEKQKDWPEYRLSLKTAEARSKAQHLAEKLRTTALGEVLQAYRSRQSLPQPSQVRHLAEVAAELRQAYLFESREERDAAQWIEVEKAKLDHSDYERLHKWDEAVELWQHLDLHYPRQSEIQTHLHTSQIQQALLHADMALTAGQGNEALNILWEAQREPSLSRSIELNLKLAEVYAGREEFDKAFEILDNQVLSGNSVDQAQAKKTEYQKEQALLDFIHRAEAECKKGRYRHALKILLEDSQTDKRLIDHPRLSEKAAQVFTARSDELTARIEEQNKLGSYPAKVNALNAALELRSLEEAMHVTGEDSTALQVIGDLRSELSQIAFNLVQKVNSYDLNGKSLEDALEETQNAVKQLEAFESIKEQFKDELDEQIESLRNALQQARTRLSNLMALEEQIEKTKAVAYWEQALTQGKFTELDSIKVEIDRINLVGIVEVDSFATKVSEYSALSKHFDQARNNITKLFIEAEDFEGVKKHIARLRSRPPTYRQENKDVPFKQIQQGDYDLAYELVGNHFNLVDLYSESGKNLSGWQVIQDVATRREADYQAWKAWADVMQEWEQKARERTTKLLADHASPPNQPSKVTLRKKKKDYSDLLAIDRDGLEKGKLLPHRSETPVPVQSEKADQQKKAGSEVVKKLEESKKWAEAMIQEIDQEITSLGGFPTQEEVAELFKTGNDVLIGKRFRQGMQIGTETEDEEKRLRMMRLKMSAPAEDEGGLVKKLKGIFGKKNQEGE